MKYNIALVPQKKSEDFVAFAQEIHKKVGHEKYLLGINSIPHISLCHFEGDSQKLDNLWKEVKKLNIDTIKLNFSKIRSKSYPNHQIWGGVSWVSLISNQLDTLKNIHFKIADIVKHPLNAAFEQYDPHLTLLNSCNEKIFSIFNNNTKLQHSLIDNFVISLGPIDENGQLLKIINAL